MPKCYMHSALFEWIPRAVFASVHCSPGLAVFVVQGSFAVSCFWMISVFFFFFNTGFFFISYISRCLLGLSMHGVSDFLSWLKLVHCIILLSPRLVSVVSHDLALS